ncbi:MAG: MBOAT family O-acyltransferase [Syntrophales bacterium]
MVFNSFGFFIFFILFFGIYLALPQRARNGFLLAGSYFFYAAWDLRFLILLGLTTLIDYTVGLAISKAQGQKWRKIYLLASILSNLTILGFFKYFNFFSDTFTAIMALCGLQVHPEHIRLFLPVGISFYTFKSISYTIDVYRRKITATRDFVHYAVYISFFPQLLAGPIERATQLLPQIAEERLISWKKIQFGVYHVFWGLFLKVFVADNLALLVNPIFTKTATPTGFEYLVAGYAFAFQIYGDFAGYSYISKGIAGILGFETMYNFNLPYFSRNPREFWHRWHISLSTWLRDYLYIPLGGNQGGRFRTNLNLMVTMLLGGLWHGANFTFIIWGAYHGALLILHRMAKDFFSHNALGVKQTFISSWLKIFLLFHAVVLGWLFFRAESFGQIMMIFNAFLGNFQFDPARHYQILKKLAFYVMPLIGVQLIQYQKDNLLAVLTMPLPLRVFLYTALFYLMTIFGLYGTQNFIYMQF